MFFMTCLFLKSNKLEHKPSIAYFSCLNDPDVCQIYNSHCKKMNKISWWNYQIETSVQHGTRNVLCMQATQGSARESLSVIRNIFQIRKMIVTDCHTCLISHRHTNVAQGYWVRLSVGLLTFEIQLLIRSTYLVLLQTGL